MAEKRRRRRKPTALSKTLGIRASNYDAASTTKHNENHWLGAYSLDADSAISSELATIRNRCRHEMRNNVYAVGIGRKHANYVVGTGPKLQINGDNEQLNGIIESRFGEWAESCDFYGQMTLAEMLHLADRELFPSGEAFLKLSNDTRAEGVALRLEMIEADRIKNPGEASDSPTLRQGLELDDLGRLLWYWVAKTHPGDTAAVGAYLASTDYDKISPRDLLHFYLPNRPGQRRGEPLLSQALEIFAKMRRWDEATIRAAELAAMFAAYMTTQDPSIVGDNPDVQTPETVEIEPGTMMVGPPGYHVEQVKPEHPGSTYTEFKNSKLTDCGAAMDVPRNVLANDSSGHNYASGRLDWQGLVRAVGVVRQSMVSHICNPVLAAWWTQARLAYPEFASAPPIISASWRFPGFEHVDPAKEANAAQVKIENKLMSYATWYAAQGLDWREEFAQLAAEKAEMERLGIAPAAPAPAFDAPAEDTSETEEDGDATDEDSQ